MIDAPEFVYAGSELDSMSAATNYYTSLVRRLAPHVGSRVVEVGAGIGTFTQYLLEGTDASEIRAVEPDAANVRRLRARFASSPRVRISAGFFESVVDSLTADSLVLINVLEHIEDDRGFLRAAFRFLPPGGRLLLYVPALPAIRGSLDDAFGHWRRYTRGTLRARLVEAGFEITELVYTNLPGVLSWFLAGRVLRKKTLAPTDVRLYDRWVFPWVQRLERLWTPPLGQSLLAVATRPPVP